MQQQLHEKISERAARDTNQCPRCGGDQINWIDNDMRTLTFLTVKCAECGLAGYVSLDVQWNDEQ